MKLPVLISRFAAAACLLAGSAFGAVSLQVSANPAQVGQKLTLTATGAQSVGSKVTFYDGAVVLGTATANGSKTATLSNVLLPAGTRNLFARAVGDAPSSIVAVIVSALGSSSYNTTNDAPTVVTPTYLQIADMNGDGIPDLITDDYADDANKNDVVKIHFGNGSGSFNTNLSISEGQDTPHLFAIADFDGDGRPDIVAEFRDSSGHPFLWQFMQKTPGVFTNIGKFTPDLGNVVAVVAADFTGDGWPDIAVVTNGTVATSGVTVYLNKADGSGAFNTASPPFTQVAGLNAAYAKPVFVNGDLLPDLIVWNNSYTVFSLLGQSTGSFTVSSGTSVTNEVTSIGGFVAGDFDGDGKLDIAVGGADSSLNGKIVVYLGNNVGTFAGPKTTSVATDFVEALATGDFNGDGIPDLVGAFFNTSSVEISQLFLGNASPNTGTFTASTAQPFSAPSTRQLEVQDLNGDGRADVVEHLLAGLSINLGSGPNITLLDPNFAVAGQQNFTLKITGTNLVDGDTVKWQPSVGPAQQLTGSLDVNGKLTVSGSALVAAAGAVSVTVLDQATGVASSALPFTVNPAPTASTPLVPSSRLAGSNDFTLKVNGTNFASGYTINWTPNSTGSTQVISNTTVAGNGSSISATIGKAMLTKADTISVTVQDPVSLVQTSALSFTISPAQTLTSLSTISVVAGNNIDQPITLTGTGFANGDTMLFTPSAGSATSIPTNFVDPQHLTASIPFALLGSADAGVLISVQDPNGSTSNTVGFQVVGPTININGVSPATVGVNSPDITLQITGSNFLPNVSVAQWTANGTTTVLASTQPTTANQITATLPNTLIGSSLAAATITVKNAAAGVSPGATSPAVPFSVLSPAVTSINPPSATAGGSNLTITITGTNFVAPLSGNPQSGSRVFWCASTSCGSPPLQAPTLLDTAFVSSTQLTAVVPGNLLVVSTPSILVSNAGTNFGNANAGEVSNSQPFPISTVTITSLTPSALIVEPAGSPNLTLLINGQGFASNATVLFNGQPASLTGPPSGTQIAITVTPAMLASPGTVPIIVQNPGGSQSPPFNLTIGQLSVSQVTPSPIVAGQPTSILSVVGNFFTSTTKVSWLDSTATAHALATSFTDANHVTAILPNTLVTTVGAAFVQVSDVQQGTLGTQLTSAPFPVAVSGPAISTLLPDAQAVGAPSFALTVHGQNFLTGSVVQWNGTALPTTLVDPTDLLAIVPGATDLATAGVALVTVLNPGGGNAVSNGAVFTIGPSPTINLVGGLSPQSVAAGQQQALQLLVTGTNYTAQSKVNWTTGGKTTTLSTGFLDSQDLTASVTPDLLASAGTVLVTVVNGTVTSNTAVFTVTAGPVPTLTSFTPAGGASAGGTPFQLTLIGSGFNAGAQLIWTLNGTQQPPLSTNFVNAGQLTAIIPSSYFAQAGSATMSVLNAGGGASGQLTFPIAPQPLPAITSFNPPSVTAASGTFVLQISGSNFVNGSGLTVQFTTGTGTTSVTNVNFVSSSTLSVLVPSNVIASGGTVLVNVVNPGPVNGIPAPYTVNAQPLIATTAGLTPSSAAAGGPSFTLTVNGSGFIGSSVVEWAGKDLPTVALSGTQLTAQVDTTLLLAGTVPVSVRNPGSPNPIFSNGVLFTVTTAPPPAAPTIASPGGLSPTTASAAAAFQLVVSGTNFVSGSLVQWNGQSLTTNFVNSTQLIATVPANAIPAAGTYVVDVVNPNGGGTSNLVNFTVGPPVPSLSPANPLTPPSVVAGAPGFTLAVTGSGFTAASVVQWNTGSAQALQTIFVDSADLLAVVPAGLIASTGTALVSVSNGAGLVSTSALFTVSATPVPTIAATNGVTPSNAVAGAAAFTLNVTGTNFVSGSVVQWNGGASATSLQTSFVSATQLTAVVPASLVASQATVFVSVVNPGGAASAPVQFTVTGPLSPQISTSGGLSPSTAVAGSPAFTLSVTGNNFVSGSIVQWNAGSVTSLQTTFVNATQLTAVVPAALLANPGTIFVSVSNPGGSASTPVQFTVVSPQAPQISANGGLSQTSALAGSTAFTMTVTGSNFIAASVVQWQAAGATTALSTAFVSSTQLTALVPATLVQNPGTAFVDVQNSPGVVSNLVTFVVGVVPPPSIASMTPSTAAAGANTLQLAITGANFQTGAVVMWNTGGGPQALLTGAASANQLTALVPASLLLQPGIALVVVQNPDKQQSNAQTFLITGQSPSAIPTVATIAPTSAAAGTSSVTLTVTGTNFTAGINGTGASVVQWNGTALPTNFVNATTLSATVASSLLVAAGNNFVNVLNGTTAQSNGAQFTISGPGITSLNPSTANTGGGAFTMTVMGANFVSGSTVSINGSSVATAFVSSSQLTAQISAQMAATPGTLLVVVTNPGGATSNPQTLTLTTLVPTIASLSPTSAVAGGSAFQLAITGTNFQSGALVMWNGTQLPTIFLSATQLNALVDASLIASAGTATVVVQNPGPATSSAIKFTIGGPTVSTVCLAAASQSGNSSCVNTIAALGSNSSGAGIQLTITGQNFIPGSTVLWNGTPVPTIFVSATQLTAVVAASFLTSPGTASVTVQNPGGAVSTPGVFTVGPFTLSITTTQLPDAIVGKSYGPVILAASGGTPPYTWTITSGALPDGLLLDSVAGSIGGTPTTAGPAPVGITLADSAQRTVSRTFPLRVVSALSISTAATLPVAIVNSPVSITFAATGGTPPYKWSSSGNVPPGLALDAGTGLLSGVPTSPGNFQFSVLVSDSGNAGGQTTLPKIFNLQIVVPDLTINGLAATSQPATQPPVNVSVSAPYASDLTGTLTLTFTSAVGVDDPNIAFSSGGRTASFTIPAGSTQADFGGKPNVALLTGTVAGTITIKAAVKSTGADVTPNPAPQIVTTIGKGVPVITSATLTKIAGGVSVGLSGFATSREVTQASITFNPAAGANLTSSTQTVNLASTFTSWYQSAASNAFGSQFVIAIPFGISGDLNAIGSVTVILSNSVGASQSVTANMQ